MPTPRRSRGSSRRSRRLLAGMKKGGMTISASAPAASAARLYWSARSVPEAPVLMITGTRPATCFDHGARQQIALGLVELEDLGAERDAEPMHPGLDVEVDEIAEARLRRWRRSRRTG